MSAIPETTLIGLIKRYDTFFIDQFGVLRDDSRPYMGAVAALKMVKDAGKTVIILSNSGRSGDYNATRLVDMGFARESFDKFVTSGDVAFSILSAPGSKIEAGARCLTISSGGDTNLATRLGLTVVDSGIDADLVVISGSEAEKVSMERYEEILRPAARRRLPCFCTNPDIHKLAGGSIAPGAGSIAKLYENLGGTVRWLGKPHIEIYEYALSLSRVGSKAQVVCIGDSVEHDILGAQGAGLDSVLVRTGILSALPDDKITDTFAEVGATPKYQMLKFGV
jgi:HAD superfamily hydrolase (TIGR01459 family)